MEFFLAMEPPTITAQEHKVRIVNGKPYFYDPPQLAEAKSILIAHLNRFKPEHPYENGIQLYVKWLFPIKGNHRNAEYRTSKPDTDNLNKALKDCMTKLGFWKDDALVVAEVIEKFWADIPGIYIRIEEAPKYFTSMRI